MVVEKSEDRSLYVINRNVLKAFVSPRCIYIYIYVYLLYKKDLSIQTLFCILTICRKVKMRSNASKNRTKLQYIFMYFDS